MRHESSGAPKKFLLELVKPSHYDDNGYVIQWVKAWIPSDSLACLYGIAEVMAEQHILGDDTEIVVNPHDEVNTVVPVKEDHPGFEGQW